MNCRRPGRIASGLAAEVARLKNELDHIDETDKHYAEEASALRKEVERLKKVEACANSDDGAMGEGYRIFRDNATLRKRVEELEAEDARIRRPIQDIVTTAVSALRLEIARLEQEVEQARREGAQVERNAIAQWAESQPTMGIRASERIRALPIDPTGK